MKDTKKITKKLAALLLSIVMVLSGLVTASALNMELDEMNSPTLVVNFNGGHGLFDDEFHMCRWDTVQITWEVLPDDSIVTGPAIFDISGWGDWGSVATICPDGWIDTGSMGGYADVTVTVPTTQGYIWETFRLVIWQTPPR